MNALDTLLNTVVFKIVFSPVTNTVTQTIARFKGVNMHAVIALYQKISPDMTQLNTIVDDELISQLHKNVDGSWVEVTATRKICPVCAGGGTIRTSRGFHTIEDKCTNCQGKGRL